MGYAPSHYRALREANKALRPYAIEPKSGRGKIVLWILAVVVFIWLNAVLISYARGDIQSGRINEIVCRNAAADVMIKSDTSGTMIQGFELILPAGPIRFTLSGNVYLQKIRGRGRFVGVGFDIVNIDTLDTVAWHQISIEPARRGAEWFFPMNAARVIDAPKSGRYKVRWHVIGLDRDEVQLHQGQFCAEL